MKELAVLNKYFLKYKYHFFGGILFVVVSNIFGVLYPRIFRFAIDMIKQSVQVFQLYEHLPLMERAKPLLSSFLLTFGLLILLMAVLKGVFMFFMRQTIIVMSRRIEFDLKNLLFDKYQQLSLSFFKRHNTGDLMARVSEDVGKVRMYLGPGVMYGINLLSLFALVIYSMLEVSPVLTLWVCAPLPFLSIAIYFVNKIILQRSTLIQNKLSDLTTYAQEAFSGIRVIKSFAREKAFEQEFEKELDDFQAKSLSLVRVNALFFPLMMALIGLSTILTIYVGGLLLERGLISAGNIAEFVIYINMLTWPVAALGWVASMIQQAVASQKRINEYLQVEPEIDKTAGEDVSLEGGIEFSNVSFDYPDSGIRALEDISFRIKPGQTLGIVGPTGSGKSTVAALLSRLYDVSEGNILLDGHPIQSLNPGKLRSQLGYVPQEVFLFSDTIANNIRFGKSGSANEEVVTAAKVASIYNGIMSFPNHFETSLGERGITLSGGQKQRVAIARAVIRKPKIYVFDDCLSALDTNTESRILANLKKLTSDTTTVIISHRISSVMNADLILVLENGQIVERGKHLDLLKNDGYYSRVNQKQQMEAQHQVG